MEIAMPWTPGKQVSTQGKVYVATFAVGLIAEFVGEIILYKTIPDGRDNLKARFWARYAMEVAMAVILGSIGYIATEVLSASGWDKTAWLFAFLPMVTFVGAVFVLQGMNTVLDSTSGVGCVGAIGAAIRKQKKVCDDVKPAGKESE